MLNKQQMPTRHIIQTAMPKHINHFTEADYENAIIELFTSQLGYEYIYGPDAVRDTLLPKLISNT